MSDVRNIKSKTIEVLVVDDSAVAIELLVYILKRDPEIKVIGTAKDGKEALAFLEKRKPDVIAMDIIMPGMDGFEATRKIMETDPVPIVIVSASYKPEEVEKTFKALEAGAVTILDKPKGVDHPDHEKDAKNLIQTLKIMSEVKVVRRWVRTRGKDLSTVAKTIEPDIKLADVKVIAIGASTGGPPVLQAILSDLPDNFPVPIVIVQHIAAGFIYGLAQWIGRTTKVPVHVAKEDEFIMPGHVYFAPDGRQMGIKRNYRITLRDDLIMNGLKPSVSYLFRSVANAFGPDAAGILLTGMGKDGAQELKLMMEKGAVTIAQSKESSAIHGMPGEAIRMGAASHIMNPAEIAATLKRLVNSSLSR